MVDSQVRDGMQAIMEPASQRGDGNPDVFDDEWRHALISGDPRWINYPSPQPDTQTELVELVKAKQIDSILADFGLHGGRVLEYACGAGGMSVYFGNRGFDTVALDLSKNALTLARKNIAANAKSACSVSLVAGDVFALPFPDGAFDVVMSYGLLEHFTEQRLIALLQETSRILRPGGLHLVDIIHGRPSTRTLASCLNFSASACRALIQRRPNEIPRLRRAYFSNYFENKLTPSDWKLLFRASGLGEVAAFTCRPFPLLALQGTSERWYVGLLQRLLPIWTWFDRTHIPGIDALGWMYLVYGRKPKE